MEIRDTRRGNRKKATSRLTKHDTEKNRGLCVKIWRRFVIEVKQTAQLILSTVKITVKTSYFAYISFPKRNVFWTSSHRVLRVFILFLQIYISEVIKKNHNLPHFIKIPLKRSRCVYLGINLLQNFTSDGFNYSKV